MAKKSKIPPKKRILKDSEKTEGIHGRVFFSSISSMLRNRPTETEKEIDQLTIETMSKSDKEIEAYLRKNGIDAEKSLKRILKSLNRALRALDEKKPS